MPWSKSKSNNKSVAAPAALQPSAPSRSLQEFAQLQSTELEVLESILGPDFERVQAEALTPWNRKATPPSPGGSQRQQQQQHTFDVTLRPDVDELKPHVSALVRFRLPLRYPDLPPIIKLVEQSEKTRGVTARQALALQDYLSARAKELLGTVDEMIWELITGGQEWMSGHNEAVSKMTKGPNRSLEEEKELREKAAQTVSVGIESVRNVSAEAILLPPEPGRGEASARGNRKTASKGGREGFEAGATHRRGAVEKGAGHQGGA